MEFLYEYGMFLLKSVTIVVAIMIVIGTMVSAAQKNKSDSHGEISIRNLSDEFRDIGESLKKEVLSKEEYQKFTKAAKKEEKRKKKTDKSKVKQEENKGTDEQGRLFVIDFDGDVKASAVESLREEITAFLSIADPKDEVMLRLESPGGMVHSYGLAASQLSRIKQGGYKLNVCVDEVAASGGYMMACVADEIIAAPFAVVGSVGVMAEVPNFYRLLQKHDVDYELHTAGEYKRTLTVFGENTDKGRQKFKEEIDQTHDLFKSFIQQHRPELDIDRIATGETWYGTQAIELKLVDKIQTSDDYLLSAAKKIEVFAIEFQMKKPLAEKLGLGISAIVARLVQSLGTSIQKDRVSR